MIKRILFLYFVLLLIATSVKAQFYNGLQQSFGKNRVQYTEFKWTFMRYKNFDIYYYQGGKEHAEFCGIYCDGIITEVERLFDYNTEGRLQIMVYSKLNDLKQTNIGLDADMQTSYNTGGTTKISGNKILVYFNGDHQHLINQIREGVAKVLLEQLMFGGSLKERLQNSILLSLPAWFAYGSSRYIGYGWSEVDDNKLLDKIKTSKFSFNKLVMQEELLAGKSFWYFLEQTYGRETFANLLYSTRIFRSAEYAFQNTYGKSSKQLFAEWLIFYQRKYLNVDAGKTIPKGHVTQLKFKKNIKVTRVAVSNDGNRIAYATNEFGRYKVFIYDTKRKKKSCVLRGGYKALNSEADESYPLLEWHPGGKHLSIIYEDKGATWLTHYYPTNKKKRNTNKLVNYTKVLSFDYADDGQSFVMSAIQKGQSDIFVWNLRGRKSTQITKDIYDDLSPSFADSSQKIVFSSNRDIDSIGHETHRRLGQNQFDIFVYDLPKNTNKLIRITNTPNVNETQTRGADDGRVAYLGNYNGSKNLYIGRIDSVFDYYDTIRHFKYVASNFVQTNSPRNILDFDLTFSKRRFAYIILENGRYKIYSDAQPAFTLNDTTRVNQFFENSVLNQNTDSAIVAKPVDTVSKVTKAPSYSFVSEFAPREKKETTDTVTVTNSDTTSVSRYNTADTTYIFPKQRNYDIALSTQYFVTQLDNQLLNASYQTFTGGSPFFDPGLNGLFKIGLTDVMEDYRMMAGVRFSGNFNSNEYIVGFDNLHKKIDQSYYLYRQARNDVIGFSLLKIVTYEAKYISKYPLNDIAAIRGTATIRNDRNTALSTDSVNLETPGFNRYWATAKMEYVLDNTISRGINTLNGFRYKIFAEMFNQLDEKKKLLTVVGFDARHYLKIYKNMIWCNRIAGSKSGGAAKLIYYLGGVDNAIVPNQNFDNTIKIDYSQNYAFQAIATNMRGFKQNIRNGSAFSVINSELRIPVFQLLSNKPIRSDFFRSFQLVGFVDAGTAWNGPTPWSKDNNINIDVIQTGPFTITVNKKTDPIVAGYGWGMHAQFIGYFMRADWSYGFADRVLAKKPLFNFSLGLDF